ncbi:MAG: hypothetical protein AB7G21_00065 [Dehalococcoidia bacterium]
MTPATVTVPLDAWRELIAAATDAAEEVYIAAHFTRRAGVQERHARLVAALEAVRTIDD